MAKALNLHSHIRIFLHTHFLTLTHLMNGGDISCGSHSCGLGLHRILNMANVTNIDKSVFIVRNSHRCRLLLAGICNAKQDDQQHNDTDKKNLFTIKRLNIFHQYLSIYCG